MNITTNNNANSIKIYINNVLHLSIKKDDLMGIQSWIDGEDERTKYFIQFSMKTIKIESEYDEIEKWKTILKLLDKEIIW